MRDDVDGLALLGDRAARAVGDGHERGLQPRELRERPAEVALALVGARGEELEGERGLVPGGDPFVDPHRGRFYGRPGNAPPDPRVVPGMRSPRLLSRGMRRLLVAAAILDLLAGTQAFLLADHAATFFAWPIDAPLSAAFIGASFWAAGVLIFWSARQDTWVRARVAIPAVAVVVTTLLAATLRHLETFSSPLGLVWIEVYALIGPVAAVLLALQLAAPGADHAQRAPHPRRPAGRARAARGRPGRRGRAALPRAGHRRGRLAVAAHRADEHGPRRLAGRDRDHRRLPRVVRRPRRPRRRDALRDRARGLPAARPRHAPRRSSTPPTRRSGATSRPGRARSRSASPACGSRTPTAATGSCARPAGSRSRWSGRPSSRRPTGHVVPIELVRD